MSNSEIEEARKAISDIYGPARCLFVEEKVNKAITDLKQLAESEDQSLRLYQRLFVAELKERLNKGEL